ncbi:unnamed protein product [Ambrosiozyma monospora]|uniref:Pre-mRNA-processing factor 19 n=1 Tax=Ambrosiozyma monospora TaxID=43982 RepID=A0A9W6YRK2_AMBMO|nr:unnamed protein product [Ambrosiozyma monospora]
MFICSISGQETQSPVLSPSSHRIYDKQQLIKYIQLNNSDPITNQPLSESDLIEIQPTPIPSSSTTTTSTSTTIIPKEPKTTSIPSLLTQFQNEWDATALELFQLRKQVGTLKQDLSLSLYKQDAAVKVAIGAMDECKNWKTQVEQLTSKVGLGEADTVIGGGGSGAARTAFGEDVGELLVKKHEELFRFHKEHKVKFPFDLKKDVKFDVLIDEQLVKLLPLGSSVENGTLVRGLINQTATKIALVTTTGTVSIISLQNGETLYSYQSSSTSFTNTDPSVSTSIEWLNNDSIVFISDNGIRFSSTEFIIPTTPTQTKIIQHPALSNVTLEITHSGIRLVDYTHCLINPVHDFPSSSSSSSSEEEKEEEQEEKDHDKPPVAAIHPDGLLLATTITSTTVGVFNLSKPHNENKELEIIKPDSDSVADEATVTNLYFSKNGYSLLIEWTNPTTNPTTETETKTTSSQTNKSQLWFYDLRKSNYTESALDLASAGSSITMNSSATVMVVGNEWFKYLKKSKVWVPGGVLTHPGLGLGSGAGAGLADEDDGEPERKKAKTTAGAGAGAGKRGRPSKKALAEAAAEAEAEAEAQKAKKKSGKGKGKGKVVGCDFCVVDGEGKQRQDLFKLVFDDGVFCDVKLSV